MRDTVRDRILFAGEAYEFAATPLDVGGWGVVVARNGERLASLEVPRHGLSEDFPLELPPAVADEIGEYLRPPAKLRHVTADRLLRELRLCATNRGITLLPTMHDDVRRLLTWAKDGVGQADDAVSVVRTMAPILGYRTPDEASRRVMDGVVLRAACGRARLDRGDEIPREELLALSTLSTLRVTPPRALGKTVAREAALRYLGKLGVFLRTDAAASPDTSRTL